MNAHSIQKSDPDFIDTWNDYSFKYNSLVEKMENKGIAQELLDQLIETKIKLTRIVLIKKMDEIMKI